MGRYVINRDGGGFTSDGMLRFLDTLFRYGVASGWTVTQRASGSNMSVDVAAGAGDFKVSSAYPVFAYSDATETIAVPASSPSNARRDLVVAFIDLAVVNDTNNQNALKFVTVAGTPASSPVDPTAQAVQTAVGAGNPYQVLARVKVSAGTSNVTTSMIDDLRVPMALLSLAAWDGSATKQLVVTNNGKVGVNDLANGAVLLGYAEILAPVTSSANTSTPIPGLSVTFTMPLDRRVKVTLFVDYMQVNQTSNVESSIWIGAVGSGQRLNEIVGTVYSAGGVIPVNCVGVLPAGSGQRTVNAAFHANSGAATFAANIGNPAFLLVEAI